MTTAELKTELIERIGFQADWRKQKASEFPDDARNEQSAASLLALAQSLQALPENDLAWARVQRAWERSEDTTTLSEIEIEILRSYGFGYEADDGGDAAKFLDAYATALEHESVVPPPAGSTTRN